ncbi:MAG TPA: hypothetical protein QGF58_00580 [Myxococcota bacterium]|nr:hypothetical protein [Myxococcota bacterium]
MIFLSLFACFEENPINEFCPDIVSLSAVVDIVDVDGEPVEGITLVQYSLDGVDFQSCEVSFEQDNRYECAWEQGGDFTVVAEAEGFESGSVEFTVSASEDDCTVDTEFVELQLEEQACTTEEVPAVMTTILGDVETAEVYWSFPNGDMQPEFWELCIEYEAGLWACALEMSGDIAIEAYGVGGDDGALVTVAHDGCHPITEDVELSLPELTDDEDERHEEDLDEC